MIDLVIGLCGSGYGCLSEGVASTIEFLFCLRLSLAEQCESYGRFPGS